MPRKIRKAPRPKKEPTSYSKAPEVEALARRLIAGRGQTLEGLHGLRSARVLFLFSTAEKVGREAMASAARYPKRFSPLGEYDFLVTVSKPWWSRLADDQRGALVYHELLHCFVDEKGSPKILPHDFEGFALEIKRFGLWTERARQMAEQMWLFAPERAKAALSPKVTHLRRAAAQTPAKHD